MSFEIAGFTFTREAAGDLSGKQFLFMQIDTDGEIDIAANQGEACDGVLQNKPSAQGQAGSIMVNGVSKVVAGETIGDGILCTTGADGRCEIAASNDIVLGKTLEAGADGEIIAVLLYGGSSHVLP